MEKTVPVRPEGVLRLPPGFRFHPTDEELVVQYLRRKVFCCPLPAAIIPEIQLSRFDPWDLPGGCSEGERYFFSAGEARHRKGGRRPCRSSAAGYWKAAGRDRRVVASGSDQVVGMKKTLVFYRGKAPGGGSRTEWVMHEYRLAGDGILPCVFPLRKNSSTHCSMARAEDWVLCRIFKKRRPARRGGGGVGVGGEGGSTARRSPPSATLSASESSCVTEASDVCGDGEEDSSSCNSASSSCSSSSPRVGEP